MIRWLLLPLVVLLVGNVVLGLAAVRRRRWALKPEPPENVRLIDRMGVEIPVQCVYAGRTDGFHLWEVIRPQAINDVTEVRGLACDVFPAKTRIVIRGRTEEP